MNENELKNIWEIQDQKIDSILSINKESYTLILIFITIITFLSGAYIMTIGFGIIAFIMLFTIISYLYHIHLIRQISHTEDVIQTQEQLSKLKISSFNCIRLAIIQIPFWSICWISINALTESPILYGGINLLIFLALSFSSYWLYTELDTNKKNSKVRELFLSGSDWEPIEKSNQLLEQIKQYQETY